MKIYLGFNKKHWKSIWIVFVIAIISCRFLTNTVVPPSTTPIPNNPNSNSNSGNVTPLASTLNSSNINSLDQVQGWVGQYDISMQFAGTNSNGVKETFSNTASGSLVLFPCSGGAGNGLDVQLTRSGDWIFPYTGNPYVDPGCKSNEFVGYWFSIMHVYDLREGTSSPAIGAKGNDCNSLTNAVAAVSLPVRLVVKPNEKTYQLSIVDRPISFASNTMCPDGGPYGLPIESKWLDGWAGGVAIPEVFQFSSNNLNLEVSQLLNLINKRQFEVTVQQSVSLRPQNLYLLVSTDYPSYAIRQNGVMPIIKANAHVFSPDPNNPITPSSFTWDYVITDQYGQVETTGSSRNAPYRWPVSSEQTSPYTLDFGNKVQEGVLTITVSTVVDGVKLTGQTVVLIQDVERAKRDAQPQIIAITPTPIAFLTPIDWGPGPSASVTPLSTTSTATVESCPPYKVGTDLNGFVNVTGAEIDAAIRSKRPDSPLIGLGQTIVDVSKEQIINPFYILAHAAWESTWGTSRLAREKNNIFGYGAYDKCPFECAVTFNSMAESIQTVIPLIKKDYLTQGGQYYHGPTLSGMNIDYATDQNWQNGIASIMNDLAGRVPNLCKNNKPE